MVVICSTVLVSIFCLIRSVPAEETWLQTEKTAVHIEEYRLTEDGQEVPWEDQPVILPGSRISKIPRIVNDGPKTRIRVRITFRGTEQAEKLEKGIFGMSADWKKARDGFYYYRKPLKRNESVDLFQGLQIPADFSQKEAGRTIYMDITVQAYDPDGWESMPERKENRRLKAVDTGDSEKPEFFSMVLMCAGAATVIVLHKTIKTERQNKDREAE